MTKARNPGQSVRKVNPNKAVTLADVAAHVGVSSVAVSVVLNNAHSKVRVSPTTRERILQAAKDLQYEPNGLARSLRLQRTNAFGFYGAHGAMFSPSFPFYAALLSGLQEGCHEHDKDLLLQSRFKSRTDNQIYMELLNGQIDGLVLYARQMTPLIERLMESRLPIVTVVHQVPGVPCVGIDNLESGRLMAKHLAACGYRSVLIRAPESELPLTVRARFQGFCECAATHNIEISYSYCETQEPNDIERRLLTSPLQRPEVVMAYSDHSADGIVAFCREMSIRIPESLAVVGFDDLPSALRPASRLSTVHCPWLEVAQKAVGMLVDLHSGKEVPELIQFPVYFVEGETTRVLSGATATS